MFILRPICAREDFAISASGVINERWQLRGAGLRTEKNRSSEIARLQAPQPDRVLRQRHQTVSAHLRDTRKLDRPFLACSANLWIILPRSRNISRQALTPR